MEKSKRTLIDIAVVIGVPAIIIMGYYFFQPDDIVIDDIGITEQSDQEQQVKQALSTIKSIQFNGEIFTDPVFISLVDQTVPIIDVDAGRDNPFVIPKFLRDEYTKTMNNVIKGEIRSTTKKVPSLPPGI